MALVALVITTFVITSDDRSQPKSNGDNRSSWELQASGTEANLNDVFIIDSSTGWVVGDNGTVLHTTDGGQNWTSQPTGTTVPLQSVDFVDHSEGWIVGKFGTILHTSDGGRTWNTQGTDVTLGDALISVDFVDSMNGWVIAERGAAVYRTLDGGVNWNRERFVSNSLRVDLHFVDADNGWVVMNRSTVLQTSDKGNNWIRNNFAGVVFSGSFFLDRDHGWIAGWVQKEPGLQFSKFLTDGVVVRTTDGGDSWSILETGTGKILSDVAFANDKLGWAVGPLGTLLESNDGGVTWEPLVSSTQEDLRSIVIVDDISGWAVGSGGTILKLRKR